MVQRDLKMENVILNSMQTQIKIVDFGLSNVWTTDNPLRTHCGSPEYAAPELFIAGKEYGPEVDLWSLGIIFYGMVVGQLPFVGGRKNQLSSQERRKKLVAQINKGLGSAQRQAVARLSPEFRTMLNRLLTADPTKRISVKELLVHPWITETGRKFVQKHPLRELDNFAHTKITKEMSELFQINENTVSTEIRENPYGKLGGMYNILKYKHVTEQFNPDNIAPTVTRNKTETTSVKSLPKQKSTLLAKSQHTLYNQCIVLLNKVSKQQIEARAKSANQTAVLTKNITKLSRSKIDPLQTKLHTTKSNYSKTNSIVINRKVQENSLPFSTVRRATSSKLQSTDNKQSSSVNLRRPHTTGTTQSAPRPAKRSNLSAATPTACKANNRESQRRQIFFNPSEMGDGIGQRRGPSSATLRKLRPKDPLANEPIARSIAGYLVKNVPDYMFNLQQIIRK